MPIYTHLQWEMGLASLGSLPNGNFPQGPKGGVRMAYYLLSSKIINRESQSVVAAASYRSDESLYSERDGLTKKFKPHEVKPETYILTPKNAPEWANNRERLWNEVEKVEKRSKAQLAREVLVALPVQLDKHEQRKLLLDFCQSNFSDQGMVADIAIHRDKANNPHAHILLTMRPFCEDGSWDQKRKRIPKFDKNGEPVIGKNGTQVTVSVHTTDWNTRKKLVEWRKDFANRINEKFIEKGIQERVSHESYEKQGIDKMPTIRLSREAYQIENRAKNLAERKNQNYEPVTYYGQLNKEIRLINKQIDKSIDKQLASIRKSAVLNSDQKTALAMVAKRAKTYVDFAVAFNVLQEVKEGKWKKKLDSLEIQIQADKMLLSKAKLLFKKDPKNVIQYGFTPTDFTNEFRERLVSLKEKETAFEVEKEKYNLALKKVELAVSVQQDLTKQEFTTIYPNLQLKDYTTKEQYLAVKEFKETGEILLPEEIKNHASQRQLSNHVPNIVEQSNSLSKSIFIFGRAIQKVTRERERAIYHLNYEKAYVASQKIVKYHLQRKQMQKELNGNQEFLFARVQDHYKSQIPDLINIEALIKLNQKIDKGEATDNLLNDLGSIYEKEKRQYQERERKTTEQNKDIRHEFEQQYSKGLVSGLFEALEAAQRAVEQQKYAKDPTKKLKRGRKRGQEELEI